MSFRSAIFRHPLVPLAVLAVIADIVYMATVRAPEVEKNIAEMTAFAEAGAKIHVIGEVTSVRAPVAASRGELKYRFSMKNVRYEGKDGRAQNEVEGFLPVTWYTPKPEDGGFAPENGAVFDLVGDLRKRRSLGDEEPSVLADFFMITRARDTRVIAARAGNQDGFLARVRSSAADRLSKGLDAYPAQRSLILAMTLGFRSELPRKMTTAFRQSGTIHIFAISGLHVMMIAGILAFCIGFCGVSKRYWALLLAPLLAAYVTMTGGQPSAMRAGLMAIVYFLAPLFGRRPDTLNTIAFSLLLLLGIDPLQISDLGFILSFSMVTGIVLFNTPVQSAFYRLFKVNAAIEKINLDAAVENPTGFLAKAWFEIRHSPQRIVIFLADVLSISTTSAFISFPLTSYFFDFCAPYSFFANIVVVPVSGLVMLSSAAGLAASCLHEICAVPFNLAACGLAWLMKETSFFIAGLPGSAPDFHFPLWGLPLWYAALWLITRALRSVGTSTDQGRD